MQRRSPAAIDLFSGCGGLTTGLKAAGFAVRAAVELDPLAAETYRLNHPGVYVGQKDIRDLHAQAVAKVTGTVDLVAGCPPKALR